MGRGMRRISRCAGMALLAALTVSAIARLVTYAATALALIVFRRRTGVAEFHIPGGTFIAVLAMLLIVWLLLNSTLQEAKIAAIAAAVGLLIYLSYRFYSRAS